MEDETESNDLDALEEGLPVRRAPRIDTWAGRMTEAIGDQMREWRRRRKMTTQALSDATEGLGHRVPRSVITNLEHRRRDYISVPELLVLAAALNIPPIILLAPVGFVATTEPLPEKEVEPWRVRGWVMGVLTPNHSELDLEKWLDGTASIKLYERHRLLVQAVRDTWKRLEELDDDRMDVFPGRKFPREQLEHRRVVRRLHLRDAMSYVERLRVHRQSISDLGYVLPVIPPDVEALLATAPPAEDSELSEEGSGAGDVWIE